VLLIALQSKFRSRVTASSLEITTAANGFTAFHFKHSSMGTIDFFLSSVVCDSTHNSLAFRATSIGQKICDSLPFGYWVAGDAAYACSESLLVPFSAMQLQGNIDGIWGDAFNFYQSGLRFHVKQTFGKFVNRFGILWIRGLIHRIPKLLGCL
jgi:DDE superfamily endonuclease